ncbi:MAG: iron-sulfur cluster repair di-iron protein [Deltaproteobacteria bacterium]|nr:iron-sulfur cluster repair di-iron protein [Deltaproteobacteria bacterium]
MLKMTTSLGELAAATPSATRVFMRHRLDFCCGGRRSLAEACERAGLNPAEILAELEQEAKRGDGAPGYELLAQGELADHIETHYHAALRRDLPMLIEAARKVERVHAARPTVPAGLAAVLDELLAEMENHMGKEEKVLFPMIRRGQRGEAVYMPVRMMEREHDGHAEQLIKIRELTGDLRAPAEACATWRALYHGLATLEAELMQHIHLENNVLFARAVQPR